ncbi:hypothetical protein [Granulicella sp. L60]|uniref:hypothetical protein n=1 Tax=Granulicella sp. L60 TaxID=1641866 RepID=UPI00131CB862|nr:hypothetical protein [Granulicella sp. L60]
MVHWVLKAAALNRCARVRDMMSVMISSMGMISRKRAGKAAALAVGLCLMLGGCHSQRQDVPPIIVFSKVPVKDEGGPERKEIIAGSVSVARAGQQIVLYARSGSQWWLQPSWAQPFTTIGPDFRWQASIHLGTEYAAVLVNPGYQPPKRTVALPEEGDKVVVVATVNGREGPVRPVKIMHFSGYDWKVRDIGSNHDGRANSYDPMNAWTDSHGSLHLRIAKRSEGWTSAEVNLTRSLGYGRYVFVVRDVSHLPPSAVLGMFTWDGGAAEQNFRELDIEVSRWGNPANKNVQYVIQPYHVSENVMRFMAPAGVLTNSFRWEPGLASFKTQRGSELSGRSGEIAEHTFTAGIPSHGNEAVHLTLCLAGGTREDQLSEAEVVIDKFEYFP